MFVDQDPLGNPIDQRHPGTRRPPRGRRSATSPASTPGSCRRAGSTSAPASTSRSTPAAVRSRGCGRRRSRAPWTSATSQATGRERDDPLAQDRTIKPEIELEWKIPQWSNTLERNRARTYFQAYAAAAAFYFLEHALARAARRAHADLASPSRCRTRRSAAASTRPCAACSRITWSSRARRSPTTTRIRRRRGTRARATATARLGPYEDAVTGTPIFEENGRDNFKGIDIMRTVRSFDPCLPCGVHMYLGDGKELVVRHSPMLGAMQG